MKNELGIGLVWAFAGVLLTGHACFGSPNSESAPQPAYTSTYETSSSPAPTGLEGRILLASSEGGKKGGGEGGKKGEGTGNSLMYEWDPVLVNLADAGGKRYLKVTMKMEMNDPKLQKELDERSYEVKDALIMILCGKEYDDISTVSGKTRLKQEIIARVNKILKTGQVKEIYFTDFIVQ